MNVHLTAHFTLHPGILAPPQSVIISLNEVAVLSCTAIADFINWAVNGIPANEYKSNVFDDSAPIVTLDAMRDLRMRTLRVLGSPDSNGVNVTCIAFLHTGTTNVSVAVSEPAVIVFQGDVE